MRHKRHAGCQYSIVVVVRLFNDVIWRRSNESLKSFFPYNPHALVVLKKSPKSYGNIKKKISWRQLEDN